MGGRNTVVGRDDDEAKDEVEIEGGTRLPPSRRRVVSHEYDNKD
jgi:hypothetical protein